MGCYQSSSADVAPHWSNFNTGHPTSSPSLSLAESMELEGILAEIPVHCREPIINLQARQFLNIYQHHLLAKYYVEQRNFLCAIAHEYRAMSQLGALMPDHKDHFIYIDMCNIMSTCYLELDGASGAVLTSQWALSFMLQHTPTNHTAISFQYSRLAIAYQAALDWKEAAYCLTKAIETARLTNDPNEEYIRQLEADLDSTKNRIVNNTWATEKFFVREVKPNPGESADDCQRRAIAETIAYSAQHGTLQIDQAEFERLPDKQTESQVTHQILKEVLQHLENYLTNHEIESELFRFIAAQFKNTRMKTSRLSPAIIEAALTMIIDQMKDDNFTDDKEYQTLKQSPFLLSYTDEGLFCKKGVREFEMKRKTKQSEEQ